MLSLFFNFRLSHFEIYAKAVARKEQQHKTFCSRQIAWHKDEFLQRKVANHLSGLLRFRLEKSAVVMINMSSLQQDESKNFHINEFAFPGTAHLLKLININIESAFYFLILLPHIRTFYLPRFTRIFLLAFFKVEQSKSIKTELQIKLHSKQCHNNFCNVQNLSCQIIKQLFKKIYFKKIVFALFSHLVLIVFWFQKRSFVKMINLILKEVKSTWFSFPYLMKFPCSLAAFGTKKFHIVHCSSIIFSFLY